MDRKVKTETQKKIENIKRAGKYKKVEENLITLMKQRGDIGECHMDLVRDYMAMWITKELLHADIRERGVSVGYDNGGGQKGCKKNESVDQMIKINAQMLKLLSELHITSSDDTGGDGDEL